MGVLIDLCWRLFEALCVMPAKTFLCFIPYLLLFRMFAGSWTINYSSFTETAKAAAAKEWEFVKMDVKDLLTPAWVTMDRQRAEYLRRVARAEHRVEKVTIECG